MLIAVQETLRARLLTPPGALDTDLSDALRLVGIETVAEGVFDALVVGGGLAVRGYLAHGPAFGELSTEVLAEVRAAATAGIWIAAPCVALAVVLRGLARDVAAGTSNRRTEHEDVIVFEDLRVVSSSRPLFGRSAEQKNESLQRIARTLAQRVSSAQRAR